MNTRTLLRQHGVALRAMLVFTLVLGVAYTAVITGVGQLALGGKADGSAVALDGETVGSSLIGQSFTDADGAALPEWFQSRPSAAGDGYDASASSGSNYGPENEDLIAAIDERRAAIAESDGVAPEDVPVDALTASSSGLDPHISPEYARIQIDRVAAARDLPVADVEALVAEHTRGRDLGYLGEPTVNVLELNTALAATSR
ncbi:potassium-transporting ATPase subunit KdpC [Frigoribacterium sp. CFBP9030]|uniref:potassium-transporting ATPase subunit KdpC n=1 Tax=Frigoribacterium sp. CFBP9030 TaxID=3096537 RepID=UPI002A6A1DC8|nr:potassium-transporting ATPase subunit KdpC [Frigoribacterium sp. CFBP9030]MDY0892307.1 potassium-transporting ATPase subunit KdpC [Frigoribacterium sp. CFBP9030]